MILTPMVGPIEDLGQDMHGFEPIELPNPEDRDHTFQQDRP
jgi:hypothetical protein